MKIDDLATFVLPGHWWSLPTSGGETAMIAAIKRHVEHAVGPTDDRATLRRELRRQLLVAARSAREIGADRLYLASQLADGVPLPATLVVARTGEFQRPVGSVEERAHALIAVVPRDGTVETPDGFGYPLVRAVVVERRDEASGRLGGVKVRYWLAVPTTGEIALFVFSCPLSALAEQLVALFDAIMSTLTFSPGVGASA